MLTVTMTKAHDIYHFSDVRKLATPSPPPHDRVHNAQGGHRLQRFCFRAATCLAGAQQQQQRAAAPPALAMTGTNNHQGPHAAAATAATTALKPCATVAPL
eukprot:TRINITY_DN480_c0_g1_i5.p3 TRINITY_DN480_c0_g1~~TRINITY_DN480_c0_g1_i5.p3  ORF type:complete len:101 (+),score=19.49 TRINITY_DN480_c0_g1_i5:525-827(+)